MEYNQKQLEAINAPENNIIIIAPAGAGKTSCLVGAIEKYTKNNPDKKVVAITFTRKAAAELQNRVANKEVEISTIHSWAYRRLQLLASAYNFTIQILDDDSIKDILKRLCSLKHQYYLNQFQLFSYVMGNYNIDIDDKLKRCFEIMRCVYIKYKEDNGLYDFTDLPNYLADVMQEYNERITDIDAFFVDEFQDIDPVQLELFKLIDAEKKVFIGDLRQSIYLFRGALENVFEQLTDFSIYELNINYRSYQEILDYAYTVNLEARLSIEDDFITDIFDTEAITKTEDSSISCIRGSGGKVYEIQRIGSCVSIDGTQCSDTGVVRRLMSDKRTQILCRSNKQVKKILSMGIENVSTIHQAKGLEYKNVILVDFPMNTVEESNIAYVGMTRAKNELCVIDFDILVYLLASNDITSSTKLF